MLQTFNEFNDLREKPLLGIQHWFSHSTFYSALCMGKRSIQLSLQHNPRALQQPAAFIAFRQQFPSIAAHPTSAAIRRLSRRTLFYVLLITALFFTPHFLSVFTTHHSSLITCFGFPRNSALCTQNFLFPLAAAILPQLLLRHPLPQQLRLFVAQKWPFSPFCRSCQVPPLHYPRIFTAQPSPTVTTTRLYCTAAILSLICRRPPCLGSKYACLSPHAILCSVLCTLHFLSLLSTQHFVLSTFFPAILPAPPLPPQQNFPTRFYLLTLLCTSYFSLKGSTCQTNAKHLPSSPTMAKKKRW
jgi:hypothetical protein